MSEPEKTGQDFLIGRVLGGTYKVERLIGEGGMGQVYQASHTRIPRKFAVKVLSIKMTTVPTVVARFQREAMIGSRLGHDHIVSVTDFDTTEDGFPYLVMELLEGTDLSGVLQHEGALTPVRATSILRQVLLALSAAHAEGVVHRDMKPENIMLCRKRGGGELAKVMDFGISKILTSDSIVTSHSQLLGTPWYMAPEQAEGRLDEIDHRTDLFSLGLIYYNMLSGTMPFAGDSVPSVLYQVVHKAPPPLGDVAPELPPALAAVVEQAIQKESDKRFQSASDFMEAVQEAMGDEWSEVLIHELGTGTEAAGSSDQPALEGDSWSLETMMPGEAETRAGAPVEVVLTADVPTGTEDAAGMAGMAPTVAAGAEEGAHQPLDSGAGADRRLTTHSLASGQVQSELPAGGATENVTQPRPASKMPLYVGVGLAAAAVMVLAMNFMPRGGGDPTEGSAPPVKVAAQQPEPGSPRELPAPAHPAAAPVAPAAAPVAPAPAPVNPSPAPVAPAPAGPAPTPAVVVETRSLTLTSEPPGATVLINGEKKGKTPLAEIQVPRQGLKLELRRGGYGRARRQVDPGSEAVTLSVTLQALKSSLSVVALHQGKPVEADVYLNGAKKDQTPALLGDLAPGKYKVRVSHPSYGSRSQNITLRPGQKGRVVFGLRK